MDRTLFATNLFYFYLQTVSQPCLKAQEHEHGSSYWLHPTSLHTIKYTVSVGQQSNKDLF